MTSRAIYDPVYAYCKAHILESQDESMDQKNVLQHAKSLKGPIKAALARK